MSFAMTPGRLCNGCFLIGCGPSLNRVDVRRLAGFDTLSFNRAYLAWGEWGFAPTWYACLDAALLVQDADALRDLIARGAVKRFFLHESAAEYGIGPSERVTLVKLLPGEKFSTTSTVVTDFGNVGATSLQFLAALGYSRVAMVGVDGHYSAPSRSAVEDENHFRPDYRRGLAPVNPPDAAKLLGKWLDAAQECRRFELDVRVASPGSVLNCFPRIEFEKAVNWVAGIPAG